ncbi:MAG: hypothetical protein EBX50_14875 [Chitinophagia bacterium]|nr:hypothetical protein [Chitinophagia bacterium]
MKKIISILIILMLCVHLSAPKALAANKNLLITEVQTGSVIEVTDREDRLEHALKADWFTFVRIGFCLQK